VKTKMLDSSELSDLINEVQDYISQEIYKHNRLNTLEDYLDKINYAYETEKETLVPNSATGKIVVIGQTKTRPDHLEKVAEQLKIDVNRLEFYLDYESFKNHPFGKYKWNDNYACILVGEMPHKVRGLNDESSMITQIENNQEIYPPLKRVMTVSGSLKIGKSSFKRTLLECMDESLI